MATSTKATIRIRRSDDLELIHELDRLSFPKDHPVEEGELEQNEWWVACTTGHGGVTPLPIGFCGTTAMRDGSVFLFRVGVRPGYRGGGLQKRMMRACEKHARKHGARRIYTYCTINNYPSMRSMIACGYRPYTYKAHPGAGYCLYFEKNIS